jgi:acetyl esterase/lipase
MKSNLVLISILLLSCFYTESFAQFKYPPKVECSAIKTYKHVDGIDLKLWIFNPSNHSYSDKTPAIVFFFGGGWQGGTPEQFAPHCRYLADRGMVAIVADYRVLSRHNVVANKCISDAKSAVRWIRKNAPELGIDPERIAAGGGSAGGHLAAATAVIPKFDESNEDALISSKPNALVLFNPALVLAPIKLDNPEWSEKLKDIKQRFGADPKDVSPYHNLKKGAPSTIIFHGTGDNTVPFNTAKVYAEKMKVNGDTCVLIAYDDEPHGFFNFGKKNNGPFIDTVNKMDKFLSSIGYLQSTPNSKNY